ncbi:hypothetical protein [Kribbella sp. NPDC023855]|uniref:hypothetical protein n=1 Tax=Kribbella sp. NPDC023855 TaxID=3154698 RepID=UPI0033FEBCC6
MTDRVIRMIGESFADAHREGSTQVAIPGTAAAAAVKKSGLANRFNSVSCGRPPKVTEKMSLSANRSLQPERIVKATQAERIVEWTALGPRQHPVEAGVHGESARLIAALDIDDTCGAQPDGQQVTVPTCRGDHDITHDRVTTGGSDTDDTRRYSAVRKPQAVDFDARAIGDAGTSSDGAP